MRSNVQYTSVMTDDGQQFLTVFADGRLLPPIDNTHPNFDAIRGMVTSGRLLSQEEIDRLVSLFDVSETIAKRFESLSARVKVGHGRVLFDGDPIDNSLTKQILRFLNDGVDDWKPLVAFFEKVQDNPNEHSRTQLYDWLNKHDFTITADGDIVAYKGVMKNDDGEFCSITSGTETVMVDGVEHKGHIPNPIGATIEMPRSLVHHDPYEGCSVGLHVGTFEYASWFAKGWVLEVHVNPRDVVSVPTDSDHQKMRTCRYTVVDVIEREHDAPVIGLTEDRDDGYGIREVFDAFGVPIEIDDDVCDPDGDVGKVTDIRYSEKEVAVLYPLGGTFWWNPTELVVE